MTTQPKTAVLLLAHGSPDSVDDIRQFLLNVTGGRPLPEPVIAEVKHRYSLVGCSPLTCYTLMQAEGVKNELAMPVYVGMRNWKPYIPDALKQMASDGVERAIAICLAPQNSRTSVGLYRAALTPDGVKPPFAIDFVDNWHDHPLLIRAFAEKLRAEWTQACRDANTRVPVIFTAHSVPQRTVTEGDPYEQQARETAALVAKEAGLSGDDWTFAFQSQGMSGGAWLGPTVEDTIDGLKRSGHSNVFIQAIGFLCDHIEVLYDIDVLFKKFAEDHGVRLTRSESLNDSPTLVAAIADVVRDRLRASSAAVNAEAPARAN